VAKSEPKVADHVEPEFVRDVFAHIAPRYDTMNSILSFNMHKHWRKVAMRQMAVREGAKCLDVATGTADWAIALADAAGAGGHVVGLDFCQEMLDIGERKIADHRLQNRIDLLHGNALALPFADHAFDAVTIGFGLRNVPDIGRVLSEMRRVVKPGGIVVSLELSKPEFAPFRALYYAYFYHILPFIGKLAVGKAEPYRWLPESLIPFPGRFELAQMMSEAGLVRVRHLALTGGICALHVGYKPDNRVGGATR
jgi:demethylmenaquinone methyltransferase/2-methoxy-6-polyprenyl-1,4-benzoquinol methylase